ncbi:MAG TPA: ABC transporter permease [Thermoanaerobaculia bacterium]|nr:ABC transporter permease [Thermoanaerobaculia bacterium]
MPTSLAPWRISRVWQALVSACRHLSRRRRLAAGITATLGLGIAAIATALNVIGSILFCHTPYLDPDRIVSVFSRFPETPEEVGASSYPDFEDLRRLSRTLEPMAATSTTQLTLTGVQAIERVNVNFVSASYFQILGVHPRLGRVLVPEDDLPPKGQQVVILSHDLWLRLGADRGVIGKTIRLNDLSFVVVGVLREGFHDLALGAETEAWVPVTTAAAILAPEYVRNRRGRWLQAVGRLRSGATVAAARSEMTAIASRLEAQYPDTDRGIGVVVRPLREYLLRFNHLAQSVAILSLASLLVLLVACTNVTGLLLVQVGARAPEIATRFALGASRGSLLVQMMAEGLLLVLPGGLLGVLLGFLGTRMIAALAPIALPGFMAIAFDRRAAAGALAITILVGLCFGCVLALKLGRIPLLEVLRTGTMGQRAAARGRSLLMIGEVAAAVMLLIGAGLLVKSLRALNQVDIGFRTENLLTFQIELGRRYADDSRRELFYRRFLEIGRSMPGAEAAALWGPGLPSSSWWYREIRLEGRDPAQPDSRFRAFRHCITPGALSMLGMTLAQGREFGEQDRAGSAPVAIVSATLAKKLWPGQSALGKRFVRASVPHDAWITVVGVAADAKHRGRQAENSYPVDLYLPFAQEPVPQVALLLRAAKAPESLAEVLRARLRTVDPEIPVFNVATLDQTLAQDSNELRFYSWLLGVFAGTALLLAAIGLYGLLAYAVAQRSREIGIRLALGADGGHIVRLLGRSVAALVAGGVALGLLGAFWLARTMASALQNLSSLDLSVLLTPLAVLLAAALAAIWRPARRALRIDPAVTLKQQG